MVPIEDAPRGYAPHKMLYNRSIRWSRLGVFDRILRRWPAKGQSQSALIDATHLKAHRTAASLLKKGLFPAALGAQKAADWFDCCQRPLRADPRPGVNSLGRLFWLRVTLAGSTRDRVKPLAGSRQAIASGESMASPIFRSCSAGHKDHDPPSYTTPSPPDPSPTPQRARAKERKEG